VPISEGERLPPVPAVPASQQIIEGVAETPRPAIAPAKPAIPDLYLSRMLVQTDAAPQKSRSGGNIDGYMHLSSLIDACMREHAISQQHAGGLKVASTVTGAMRIVWRIGRAVEKHIRTGIIEARDHKAVHGVWKCPCEVTKYLGEYQQGRTCLICRKPVNRYDEPVLKNDFCRVVGSPDLTLIEMGYYMPVEIKSMNKDQFDKLERPLADHILQGCAYRWMYEQLGYPVMDIVPIVYGRKDFKFGGGSMSVYKEFHANYFDWSGQVESMMTNARMIAQHNEAGTLPDRTLCHTVDCARAKKCQRASLCFNL